jgi:hypothetical protein
MLKESVSSKKIVSLGLALLLTASFIFGLSQTTSARGVLNNSATTSYVEVKVHTANINNAGTDDPTYISFGGREFRLDNAEDNCERNDHDIFIYGGEWANVSNPNGNNPQTLTKGNVLQYPIFIRKGADGTNGGWAIKSVKVTFYYNDDTSKVYSRVLSPSVWLEDERGLTLYIKG